MSCEVNTLPFQANANYRTKEKCLNVKNIQANLILVIPMHNDFIDF